MHLKTLNPSSLSDANIHPNSEDRESEREDLSGRILMWTYCFIPTTMWNWVLEYLWEHPNIPYDTSWLEIKMRLTGKDMQKISIACTSDGTENGSFCIHTACYIDKNSFIICQKDGKCVSILARESLNRREQMWLNSPMRMITPRDGQVEFKNFEWPAATNS